jgi:hypothetical protein
VTHSGDNDAPAFGFQSSGLDRFFLCLSFANILEDCNNVWPALSSMDASERPASHFDPYNPARAVCSGITPDSKLEQPFLDRFCGIG